MYNGKPILLTFVASLLGGSCVAITMQPFDVLATRLYNQGNFVNDSLLFYLA
jgi:solute carrier family 25 protein 34/35